ncbi:helix-turn-helix DNA binding domain protein [Streptomyces phage Phredrick]|nr:helix-turn-helix DNA binding domain protein [Streptomyces phage Kenrey]WNN94663.1 helix-turn-helix DNA binding domain protein [Streptomyces phage Phredrick]
MAVKKHRSRTWLYRQYIVLRRSVDEIAEECNVDKRTIYRQLETFEIVKKR